MDTEDLAPAGRAERQVGEQPGPKGLDPGRRDPALMEEPPSRLSIPRLLTE